MPADVALGCRRNSTQELKRIYLPLVTLYPFFVTYKRLLKTCISILLHPSSPNHYQFNPHVDFLFVWPKPCPDDDIAANKRPFIIAPILCCNPSISAASQQPVACTFQKAEHLHLSNPGSARTPLPHKKAAPAAASYRNNCGSPPLH